MRMQQMSYKDYVWPLNPEKLQIEHARNIRKIPIPFSGSVLQDLGCEQRVVTGKGEFIGSTCIAEFNRLAAVFSKEGSGTLRLPGTVPFPAIFFSLKMVGEAKPDCVFYEFTFLEESGSAENGAMNGGSYLCEGGESLWTLANLYHTTVDTLKSLNPLIEWPNCLETGQKVVLP